MADEKELALVRQIDAPNFKTELARAIPNQLKADRLVRMAITMIRANGTLARCTPISVMATVVECAQLGLELDPVIGHAYPVPFGDQCTLIVGYRGFSHLMYQSGAYNEIGTEIVQLGDKFKFALGADRNLTHEPVGPRITQDPTKWRGAYAYTISLNGHYSFYFMDREEIETTARNRSKSWASYKRDGKSTPWMTDPVEMYRKTPLRRHAKRSQVSTTDKRDALLRAVMLDEYGERKGLLLPTMAGWTVNPNPPEQPVEEPLEPTREVPPAKASSKKATPTNPAVPRAKIPPMNDDPVITTKEQTDLCNRALKVGWRMEELTKFLKKEFGGLTTMRRSQLAKAIEKIEAGT